MGQLRDKTKNDITEEKAMMEKQIATLQSLESALGVQLQALNWRNKTKNDALTRFKIKRIFYLILEN